jgi:hypothetical protein
LFVTRGYVARAGMIAIGNLGRPAAHFCKAQKKAPQIVCGTWFVFRFCPAFFGCPFRRWAE